MELKHILWEDLPSEQYQIVEHRYLSQKFQKISFHRDSDYRLICYLTGKIEDTEKLKSSLDQPIGDGLKKGQFVSFEGTIRAERDYVLKADIDTLLIKKQRNSLNPIPPYSIEAEGEIEQITLYYDHSPEAVYIKYWLLNGEQYTKFCYYNTMKISEMKEIDFELTGIRKYNKIRLANHRTTDVNSIELKIRGKKFVFGYVKPDQTKGPSGSYLMFSRKNFPNADELITIQDCLSFIIGKELILIGDTTYSNNWSPIKQTFYSSGRSNLNHILNVNAMPVIPVSYDGVIRYGINLQKTINSLFSKYYRIKDIIPLNQIMFYLNTSRTYSTNLKMQPLSTSLDLFKTAWFKSHYSKSHGKDLQDKRYDKIISKNIYNIEKSLGTKPTTTPILNRIKKCNEMSNSEKDITLFKEIGLVIEKVEKEALKARNIVVHGSIKPSKKPSKEERLYFLTQAYYVVVAKLILKLLKYDGYYIDYSTIDFPSRKIDETLKGPNNDGKI